MIVEILSFRIPYKVTQSSLEHLSDTSFFFELKTLRARCVESRVRQNVEIFINFEEEILSHGYDGWDLAQTSSCEESS